MYFSKWYYVPGQKKNKNEITANKSCLSASCHPVSHSLRGLSHERPNTPKSPYFKGETTPRCIIRWWLVIQVVHRWSMYTRVGASYRTALCSDSHRSIVLSRVSSSITSSNPPFNMQVQLIQTSTSVSDTSSINPWAQQNRTGQNEKSNTALVVAHLSQLITKCQIDLVMQCYSDQAFLLCKVSRQIVSPPFQVGDRKPPGYLPKCNALAVKDGRCLW